MKINLIDNSFLSEVENYTGSFLQKKEDVKKIIDAVVAGGKENEFEELTFTAKYICGMLRVIKNAPGIPEVTSIEHIKSDLSENIKKGIEQLKQILSSVSESEQNYFEQTYFKLTTQNFTNLSGLFSDLESVKKFLNYLKRQI
ncbi:MAG: hypothetical protein IPM14_09155 [bacterium]|nr:hypothetical protein [bacterium]